MRFIILSIIIQLFMSAALAKQTENQTAKFLGGKSNFEKIQIELKAVHDSLGGRNIFILGSGPALVSVVEPSKEGKSLLEKRYIFSLNEYSFARIIDSIISNDFTNLKIKDRLGATDEARVHIFVTNPKMVKKSISAWERTVLTPEAYEKSNKYRFDEIYKEIKNVEQIAKMSGRTVYEGAYKGFDDWVKFIKNTAKSKEIILYNNPSQAELKRIFKKYKKDPIVSNATNDYKVVVPGLKVYSVIGKRQLVEDPIISERFVLTPKKKVFYHYQVDQAVASINFVPQTEKEALEAAAMMAKIDDYSYVIFDPESKEFKAYIARVSSRLDFSQVTKPYVEKKEGHYQVVLWTYKPREGAMGIMFNEEYLSRYTIKLGKGICEMISHSVP